MPKGVEHVLPLKQVTQLARVPDSLMPKGVEHTLLIHPGRRRTGVPDSLMPKGVEHDGRSRSRGDRPECLIP